MMITLMKTVTMARIILMPTMLLKILVIVMVMWITVYEGISVTVNVVANGDYSGKDGQYVAIILL